MNELAERFKALSEPIRLRILNLLANADRAGGELCVCDLMETLDLPQSTVSRHVNQLRRAGFVDSRRGGVWTYYRLRGAPALGAAMHMALLSAISRAQGAAQDIEALELHLRTKKANACGTAQQSPMETTG